MKYLMSIGLVFFLLLNVAHAEEISVGVKNTKPFAYQEDGKWKGIDIELVKLLSEKLGTTYKIETYDTIPNLIAATKNGKVDMAVSALSLTYEREKIIDFSHEYFTTLVGILAHDKSSWVDNIIWMVERILIVVVVFIMFLYVIGYIMDKVDGDGNIKSPTEGAWWALVTFTTTGYGDLVPNTNKGKIVASIWMVASLFLISIFTGYMASAMTVKRLTETPTSLAQLYDADVVTIKGSTAQDRLITLGIKHKDVKNVSEAVDLFKSGHADVIVYDDAMLHYAASSMDDVSVWGIENSEENYAIGLPQDSPLTEKVNLGILKVLASDEWKAILMKYNVL